MRVTIDYERAEQVWGTMYKRFLARQFPYNMPEAQPPQVPENMPQVDFMSGRDRASFFFVLCLYMRGKIKSHTATRGMSRMYEQWPELFQAEVAMNFDPEILAVRLKQSGLGFACFRNACFWIENMRRLHEQWKGDPRNIFTGTISYEELCGRICNPKTRRKKNTPRGSSGFIGFQEKMASMLIYFLLDASLIARLPFPLPVDFHVMRNALGHEFARIENGDDKNHFKEPLMAALRQLSSWFSKKHGIDDLHLSEFVWLFSRTLCAQHPGNMSKYVGERRDRSAVILAKPVTWAKSQRRTYNLTCGQCPIESTCEYCIPAAPYYNYAHLVIRGRRERQPQKTLYQPFHLDVVREKRDWKKEPKDKNTSEPDPRQSKLFQS